MIPGGSTRFGVRYHHEMAIDMKALARTGAEARIKELQAEMADIQRAFPGIGGTSARRVQIRRGGPAASPSRRRTRPKMSAAQRKAVGERMKKYWAKR